MIISQGLLTLKPVLASVSTAFYSPKVPKVSTDQVNIIALNAVLKSTVWP